MPDVTAPFGFPYPEDTDLVRDGAADIEALAEGVNDQLNLGFQLVGTRYYTSSGTFVKADPFGDSSFDGAKLRAIRVRMVGGGGGAGGAVVTGAGAASSAAGAGGAGFCEKFFGPTDIAGFSTTETVTRGDGGAGGAAGGNGSTGGASTFKGMTAAGGDGTAAEGASGVSFRNNGGGGGNATGGDLNIIGGAGGPSIIYILTNCEQRPGGGSFFSPGGRPQVAAGGVNGANGIAFGGGGNGGANGQSQATARTGGNGAAGIVIIDVFA